MMMMMMMMMMMIIIIIISLLGQLKLQVSSQGCGMSKHTIADARLRIKS
jgi:hypothetical protein